MNFRNFRDAVASAPRAGGTMLLSTTLISLLLIAVHVGFNPSALGYTAAFAVPSLVGTTLVISGIAIVYLSGVAIRLLREPR